MTDKKQILDNLMEHGKTTGKLTTKEITDALEKLDYDVEQMDSFYAVSYTHLTLPTNSLV